MSKFQKGDVVYRACALEFEGEVRALAVLGRIAAVCPKRGGGVTYILHNYDPAGSGHVWASHSVEEGELHSDPLDAMEAAIEARDAAAGGTGGGNG